MHSMNWDDLRILRAVGHAGSYSGAARQLEITHSTVSRRMRALEASLGVALFEQVSGSLVLTAAGEDLAVTSSRLGEEVDAAELRVMGRDAELKGSIKLSIVDATARNLMPSFERFLTLYPGIELEIEVGPNLTSLPRREADVIVRATNSPPEILVGRKVATHNFPVYATPALLEKMGQETPLADFPWVLWGNGMMDTWMDRYVPQARVVCRANTASAMVEAVRAGIGLGHLSCYGVDTDPDFVRIYPADENFNLGIWLLTHPDLRKTARIRTFMKFLDAEMTAQRDTIEGRAPTRIEKYKDL